MCVVVCTCVYLHKKAIFEVLQGTYKVFSEACNHAKSYHR